MHLSNMMFKLAVQAVIVLSTPLCSAASCPCGYRASSSGKYYTNAILSDFSKTTGRLTNLNTNTAATVFNNDWTVNVRTWLADPPLIPRNVTEGNVWIDSGNLVLQQSAYSGGYVYTSEIFTKRKDISHGTFRSTFRVSQPASANKGSVVGFFWYYNDAAEFDIEILTQEASTSSSNVHYTTQPGNGVPGFTVVKTLPQPWSVAQYYRMDYDKTTVSWYQSNSSTATAVATTTANVPAAGLGAPFYVNLWANNNSFSGYPSSTNVNMYISNILLYFNSTSSEAGTDATFNTACQAAGGVKAAGAVCAF